MPLWAREREQIDHALEAAIGRHESRFVPRVGAAVRYALTGEGKRIRGLLVSMVHRACGGLGDPSTLAAAIEIVHAYSLVHDDLPCMDDDDMRRGRPTVHRAFDVPTATVAGLAMVPLAARVALDGADLLQLDTQTTSAIIERLFVASGAGGMIGGQLLDLLGEHKELSLDDLERVHRGKTGALISAAAAIGAISARAEPDSVRAFDQFGGALGLAFQITDDVLDVTSTSETLGKTAGRDVDLAKSTYATRLGVDAARARARDLIAEGCQGVRDRGLLTADLEQLANLVLDRRA